MEAPRIIHLIPTRGPSAQLTLLTESSRRVGMQPRLLGLERALGRLEGVSGAREAGGGGGERGAPEGRELDRILLLEALSKLHPSQPVLVTQDNLLIQRAPGELVDFARLHPRRVIFAAQRRHGEMQHLYPAPLKFPMPFLSTSAFAGCAEALILLLSALPFSEAAIAEQYIEDMRQDQGILVDHSSLLIGDLRGSAADLVFKDGFIVFRNKIPAILRAPLSLYSQVARILFDDTPWVRKQILDAGLEAASAALGLPLQARYVPGTWCVLLLTFAILVSLLYKVVK